MASGYVLENPAPGELLYELGLREDDVPLTLNGHGLGDALSVLEAFMELRGDNETSFHLVVQRGAHTLNFYYEVVP